VGPIALDRDTVLCSYAPVTGVPGLDGRVFFWLGMGAIVPVMLTVTRLAGNALRYSLPTETG